MRRKKRTRQALKRSSTQKLEPSKIELSRAEVGSNRFYGGALHRHARHQLWLAHQLQFDRTLDRQCIHWQAVVP